MEQKDKKIICTDKDGQKFEVTSNQLKFRPSVYGVVIKDGKILLARQWDGYDFPGGGVNLGETIMEALAREMKEETGFDVAPKQLMECADDFHKMTFTGGFAQAMQFYYLCEIVGGKLSKDNFDAGQFENKYMDLAEWVDINDAGQLKFFDPCREAKLRILQKIKNENQTG